MRTGGLSGYVVRSCPARDRAEQSPIGALRVGGATPDRSERVHSETRDPDGVGALVDRIDSYRASVTNLAPYASGAGNCTVHRHNIERP